MKKLERWNVWILGAILLFLPFDRIPSLQISVLSHGVTIRVSQVLGVALILLSLPRLWAYRSQLVKPPWLWLGLFLLFSLVSALGAIDSTRSLMVWAFTFYSILLALAISGAALRKNSSFSVRLLLFGALISSAFGLYQFFGDLLGVKTIFTGLRESYSKAVFGFPRLQSTALEPLYFADYLLIPLGVSMAGAVFMKRWRLFAILLAAVLILTASRGGLVGAVALMLCLGVFAASRRKLGSYFFAWLLLLFGVIVGLGIIAFGATIDSSKSTTQKSNLAAFEKQATNISEGASVIDRGTARELAIDAFKERPLTGIGPGNFGIFAHRKLPGKFPDTKAIANNEPLELLAETGMLGLLSITIFAATVFFSAMKYIFANHNTDYFATGLLVALVGISVQYLSFSTLYITHIWVAVGLLIGLTSNFNNKRGLA